jgi:large subunit ribosomal protein L22
VATTIGKLVESAVANARQADGFGGDDERLYVSAAYADQGPSAKRVRPAPRGRAFRVLKRTTHLTVQVAERAVRRRAPASAPSKTRTRRTGAGAADTNQG